LFAQQRKETDELRAQLAKLQRVAEQLETATARATAAEKHAKVADWDLEVRSSPGPVTCP
jgi:type II secretory pathway component PulM